MLPKPCRNKTMSNQQHILPMTTTLLLGAGILLLFYQLPITSAQIPIACSDDDSLENLRCCPVTADGVCGADSGRGQCVEVEVEGYSMNTTDVRANWPHYYTEFCQCNGNYSGVDCSRCRFGHYGDSCDQFQVLPRPPVATFSDDDWADFIDILQKARRFDSRYLAVLEESLPGNSSLRTSNVSLYGLYVWMHHYAAKDSSTLDVNNRLDYAHAAPGFTTWHRYLNLWLEWELQYMLESMGDPDYHTFRLPYWDWRQEIQKSTGLRSENLFSENRLGATINVDGFPRVTGAITSDGGWDTICWLTFFEICDPNISTGPLQRCPFTGTDPCNSENPDWPTLEDVNAAIDIDDYDAPPYNLLSISGYRSFVDFKLDFDYDRCRDDRMCRCIPLGGPECDLSQVPPNVTVVTLTGQMHFTGHIIPGTGDVTTNLPANVAGQMAGNESPNDPFFIVHHTMVDCMFDEWLSRHPDAEYPDDIPVTIPTLGHQPDDFMVPFIPLFTNAEMFKRTYNFGYSCSLPNITSSADVTMATTTDSGGVKTVGRLSLIVLVCVMSFVTCIMF